MNAGKRLREILPKIDLKPTELAAEAGVTYENIRYYYTQKRFSAVILSRIADAMKKRGVNMEYFQEEKAEMFAKEVKPTMEKIYDVLVEIRDLMKNKKADE